MRAEVILTGEKWGDASWRQAFEDIFTCSKAIDFSLKSSHSEVQSLLDFSELCRTCDIGFGRNFRLQNFDAKL